MLGAAPTRIAPVSDGDANGASNASAAIRAVVSAAIAVVAVFAVDCAAAAFAAAIPAAIEAAVALVCALFAVAEAAAALASAVSAVDCVSVDPTPTCSPVRENIRSAQFHQAADIWPVAGSTAGTPGFGILQAYCSTRGATIYRARRAPMKPNAAIEPGVKEVCAIRNTVVVPDNRMRVIPAGRYAG